MGIGVEVGLYDTTPVPTLVQHQSSAMNAITRTTCPGNNYKIRVIESVGSGNCLITIHVAAGSSGQRLTIMAYDIVGAHASPYDNAASYYGACSEQTYVDNWPSLTPNYADGLTLALLSLGTGPATGFHTGYPSGAVFHACTYDGMDDYDYLNNAAGQAHLYYQNTTQQNWNWTITPVTDNAAMGLAVAFRKA